MGDVQYTHGITSAPSDGIVYRAGSRITSVRGAGEYIDEQTGEVRSYDMLKDASGFGTLARAEEALECWRAMDLTGAPASSTSFFREMYARMHKKKRFPAAGNATANNMVAAAFYGGWIEVMQRGRVHGPIWHYDVNQAYLWAGGQGLPSRIYPYHAGDPHFLALAWIKSHREPLPKIIEERRRMLAPALVTGEDVEHYGLDIEVHRGVSWKENDFKPDYVLEELAGELPFWLFKKCTQSYWGLWAARKPVEVESRKNGEVKNSWKLYNRFQHLVWAQLIISRIVRHVHEEARKDACLVYVDSVLTGEEIPTSDKLGGWKLEEEFPEGVFVRAPGVWDRWPDAQRRRVDFWHKHAGYAHPAELDE